MQPASAAFIALQHLKEREQDYPMKYQRNSGHRLWTRPFIFACLVCLFTGFSMNMLNSTMAKYIYSIYGNASFSGLLNASFALFAILGRVLAGNLSDKYGRRLLMVAGCLIFAVAAFCFGLFPWIAMLIVFRGLQGLGYSISTTADYAAGVDVIPPDRMNEGIGYIGIGYCLATAIGPALAMRLIIGDDYRPMFLSATLMVLLACGCAAANNYEKDMDTDLPSKVWGSDTPKGKPAIRLWHVIEPKALPATLIQFLNCMAFAAINSFIVIYAESLGMSHVSAFFTCMAIAMILTRLFSGRITDRIGPIYVVSISIAMSMVGFISLLCMRSEPMFYFVGFLMGFATGTANPVLQAAAIKASPDTRRGAASGTFQLSNDVANGLGALLWGYQAMFVGCLAFSALAVLCLTLVFRNRFVGSH